MTRSERRLWHLLRNRTFFGYKFRRQFPVAGYVLDFFCPELRLALEVDGEHHSVPGMTRHDDHRTVTLRSVGVAVVRIANITVARDPRLTEEQVQFEIEMRVRELKRVPRF